MTRVLKTEHLIVRRFRPEDAARLYENHGEEEVRRWIPNECYADIGEARDAVRFYADCARDGRLPFVLAVEARQTGELIGDVGINEVEGSAGEVEIGYVICKGFRGRGYAAELVRAMTEYAASKFGITAVYGRVMRGNAASVRVLEKNGYAFVKEEFGAEDDPYGNGMLVYRKDCADAERRSAEPRESD